MRITPVSRVSKNSNDCSQEAAIDSQQGNQENAASEDGFDRPIIIVQEAQNVGLSKKHSAAVPALE